MKFHSHASNTPVGSRQAKGKPCRGGLAAPIFDVAMVSSRSAWPFPFKFLVLQVAR